MPKTVLAMFQVSWGILLTALLSVWSGCHSVGGTSPPEAVTTEKQELVLAPGWTVAGFIYLSRTEHTATLLQDGRVLVAGGRQTNLPFGGDLELPDTALYDPVTDAWSPAASMLLPRDGHTQTLLPDGRVLVIGGAVNGGQWKQCDVYDPTANQWSWSPPLAMMRADHTATLLASGDVLVVGGTGELHVDPVDFSKQLIADTATAAIYHPSTTTWSNAASMSTVRSGHTATLLPDGRVLVVAGMSCLPAPDYMSWSCTANAGAELYDPTTDTWSPAASLSMPRRVHTATLLPSGKVLVAGGFRWPPPVIAAPTEIYDPASDTWSIAATMATPRSGHAAVLLPDGRVLAAGGSSVSSNTRLDSAEIYDPATDTWSSAGSMHVSRGGFPLTLLPNGKVLASFGFLDTDPGASHMLNAELFDPSGSGSGGGSSASSSGSSSSAAGGGGAAASSSASGGGGGAPVSGGQGASAGCSASGTAAYGSWWMALPLLLLARRHRRTGSHGMRLLIAFAATVSVQTACSHNETGGGGASSSSGVTSSESSTASGPTTGVGGPSSSSASGGTPCPCSTDAYCNPQIICEPFCETPGGVQPGAAWPVFGYCPTHRGLAKVNGPKSVNVKWKSMKLGPMAEPIIDAGGDRPPKVSLMSQEFSTHNGQWT